MEKRAQTDFLYFLRQAKARAAASRAAAFLMIMIRWKKHEEIMMSSSGFSTSFRFWLFFFQLLSSSSQRLPCLFVFLMDLILIFLGVFSVVVIARIIKNGKMAAAAVVEIGMRSAECRY